MICPKALFKLFTLLQWSLRSSDGSQSLFVAAKVNVAVPAQSKIGDTFAIEVSVLRFMGFEVLRLQAPTCFLFGFGMVCWLWMTVYHPKRTVRHKGMDHVDLRWGSFRELH